MPVNSGPAITTLSATQMAAKIAAGELSAEEVVDAHIARIEEVNGRLDAVVSPRYTEAREEARKVDAARARGENLGPLAGVPMTIKEQFDVAGLPTTFGLPNRRNHIAHHEGPLLQRLREAGADHPGQDQRGPVPLLPGGGQPPLRQDVQPLEPGPHVGGRQRRRGGDHRRPGGPRWGWRPTWAAASAHRPTSAASTGSGPRRGA